MVTPSREVTMGAMEIGTTVTPIYAQRTGRYDIPRKWSVKTDIVHPCCGLLEVKHFGMEHAECDKVVRPYQEQQLLVFTESCKICGCHCRSLIEFFQHYDIHHYGLCCCICAMCRNIYLSESMLMFHITEAHGGPVTFK